MKRSICIPLAPMRLNLAKIIFHLQKMHLTCLLQITQMVKKDKPYLPYCKLIQIYRVLGKKVLYILYVIYISFQFNWYILVPIEFSGPLNWACNFSSNRSKLILYCNAEIPWYFWERNSYNMYIPIICYSMPICMENG